MSNANKALTNYIVGLVMTIFIIVLFLVLGNTNVQGIGNESGTGSSALAGIAFIASIILMLISYSLSTLIFTDVEKAKGSIITILISTLMISSLIAFEVFIFDYYITNPSSTLLLNFIIYSSLTILLTSLNILAQTYLTRFLMSTIALNRADEWEYNNFLELSLNRINIKHLERHSEIKYKGKLYLVKFIIGNNQKVFNLSGERKDAEVIEMEKLSLDKNTKSFIVIISGSMPKVEGSLNEVKIVKDKDLVKEIKTEYKNGK